MNAIQFVVFDLDDTLYLERDYAHSGFDAVAERFAGDIGAGFDIAARCRQLFDSPHRARVFNTLLAEANPPHAGALLTRMIEVFRTHTPRIALTRDADRAIHRLGQHLKLGLISDGFLVAQQAKVRALGLEQRLDAIVLTDQWGRPYWKPHPRAFETIARCLHVTPQSCVYVADNPRKDFVAPNALGWTTIMIRRPGAVHADAHATATDPEKVPFGGTAEAVIDTLDALLA